MAFDKDLRYKIGFEGAENLQDWFLGLNEEEKKN